MRLAHLSCPKIYPYCEVNALSPEPLAESKGDKGARGVFFILFIIPTSLIFTNPKGALWERTHGLVRFHPIK